MFVNVVQGSTEWHKLRSKSLGASDAPVVMGVSPWKTPYQLWEQKVGLRQQQVANNNMMAGTALEEPAREIMCKELGCDFKPAVYLHNAYKWMIASLDGIDEKKQVGIEIKLANEIDHQGVLDGKVPEKYYPQLQHQMLVTGLSSIFYCSFRNINTFNIVEVKADERYISEMILKENEFWDCVQNFEAPKLIEKDYVCMDLNEGWCKAALHWKECNQKIKDFESLEKEYRNQLIKMTNGSNCKGHGIKVSKLLRKGFVDYKNVPELEDIDLDKYRKPSTESWRFSIE